MGPIETNPKATVRYAGTDYELLQNTNYPSWRNVIQETMKNMACYWIIDPSEGMSKEKASYQSSIGSKEIPAYNKPDGTRVPKFAAVDPVLDDLWIEANRTANGFEY